MSWAGGFSIKGSRVIERRRAAILCALTLLAMSGNADAADVEVARGHIALAGPWTSTRSTSVVTDQDSVDGFFFPAPAAKTRLKALVTRNGSGLPYYLSLNFHGPTRGSLGRNYLGGCTGYIVDADLGFHAASDVECEVPAGATTGEVSSFSGADLDVSVIAVGVVAAPKPAKQPPTSNTGTNVLGRRHVAAPKQLPGTGVGAGSAGLWFLAASAAVAGSFARRTLA